MGKVISTKTRVRVKVRARLSRLLFIVKVFFIWKALTLV